MLGECKCHVVQGDGQVVHDSTSTGAFSVPRARPAAVAPVVAMVIMMGRNRRRPARRTASTISRPSSRRSKLVNQLTLKVLNL